MADSNPFDIIDQNYASAGNAPASANPFDAIDKQYNATVEKSPPVSTEAKTVEPATPEPAPLPEPIGEDIGMPVTNKPYAPGFKFDPIAPGAKHPVDLYKPELMNAPQFKERSGQNLYQNAIGDIGDMITGVAGMANAGVLRGIQAAPKELQSIGIPGQGKALFGHITNAPDVAAREIDAAWDRGERPNLDTNIKALQKAANYAASDPDAQAVGQFFGNLADYYNQRYIQPWGQGMTPGVEALKEQFWKHPIGTPLDLGLGGAFKTGAGAVPHIGAEAARIGGRGLSQAALATMGRQGLRKLRKLKQAPQTMWERFGKDIQDRGYVNTLMNETFNKKNNEYYQWFDQIVRELDDAYKSVPENFKERLTSGMEHVDTEMMDWIKGSPETQAFVDKLRSFDEGWTQRAIDSGLLTKEQVQFARYAPQYMAEMKKAGIDLKFKDLWTPEGIEEINDYAAARRAESAISPQAKMAARSEQIAKRVAQDPRVRSLTKQIAAREKYNRKELKRLLREARVSEEQYNKAMAEFSEQTKGGVYHGTSRKIEKLTPGAGSGERNLYGPGFYTTADFNIAQSYTAKGAGAEATVYKVQWKGDKPPKIFDLETALSPEDIEAFVDHDPYMQQAFEDLPKNSPTKRLYSEFKDNMQADDVYSYDALEHMESLVARLEAAGYDGFTHIGGGAFKRGGKVLNETPHQVTIFFDVEKIALEELVAPQRGPVVNLRDLPRKVEEANPVGPLRSQLEEVKAQAAKELEQSTPMPKEGNPSEPLWMTIREAEKVRDFLVNKAGKPLKTVQEDVSIAMDRLESMVQQDANGNYTLRIPGMERDALKLAKDGLLRTIRATLIQEAVQELMNNPALKNPQKGWVEVQMDKVFGNQTKSHPVGAMVKQELAKTLYLPKDMAKGLQDLASAPRIQGMIYDLALRAPARMLSKTVLGLDPLRYPKQWLQNAAIFGFTQVNSPRDIIPAMISMGLAANPKVRNWIPGHFWTGQTAVKVAEEFSRDMPKWLQALGAPDKLLRAHLEMVERQDNYWRAATALSQATKEVMRAAGPAQLKLFNDSFRLSYWAQKNIKRLFRDEATANRYFNEVKRTMGDYNAELKGAESAIADNIMFYRWKRHSMILTASLPFDNPHKTAALHAIAEVSRTMAESEPVSRRLREAGAVVARDENGEPIIGPNGDVMVYLKGKTLAFMLTQLEDIRFISKMINREGLGDVDSGSQPFVPFWNIVGGAIGIKPSTMGEFKNPNAITAGSGGPQVDIKKAKAFMDGSYELTPADFEQRPQQPWEANLGRNLTGPVYSAIVDFHERIQQIPGVPSDFSTISTSAAKRTPSGEKRKPAPYAGPFGVLQLTEPAMDRETEESIEGTMRNKLRKSFMFKTREREDLE